MKRKIFIILFALVVVLSFSLVTAVPAGAKEIHVSTYGTIQAAIDAAEDYDTIIVEAGTYSEDINIWKPLTLVSTEGSGATTIQGVGTQWTVQITSDDVTFGGEGAGFKVVSNGEVAVFIDVGHSGCTVEENHLVAYLGNSALVVGVLSANHAIQDNLFSAEMAGILVSAGGDSTHVDFIGNVFNADSDIVDLCQAAADSSIEGNYFYSPAEVTLDLLGDDNTVINNHFLGDLPPHGLYVYDHTGLLDIGMVLEANEFLRAVAVDQTGKSYLPKIWANIQEAVNQAAGGDTVDVRAGLYDEQILISKALTLQGFGTDTVIQPSAPGVLTQIRYLPWIGGGTKDFTGIIIIDAVEAPGVTLKEFIVDGIYVDSAPAGSNWVAGILYNESPGLIDGVTVVSMHTSTEQPRTNGIYLSATIGDFPSLVEVRNCLVENYNRGGIYAFGSKLAVNIHDNTVVGPGVGQVQCPNGMFLLNGASGVVGPNNIIHGNWWKDTDWWACGIGTWDTNGVIIWQNNIWNCQSGIGLSGDTPGGTSYTQVVENTLTECVRGVFLENPGTVGNEIAYNEIHGNDYGIYLEGPDSPYYDAGEEVGPDNVAYQNNIDGNWQYGVVNCNPAVTFNADCNWWGSPNGPTHPANTFNVGLQGDAVSDYVTYVPWLDGTYQVGNPFAPVGSEDGWFSSIQAAINAAGHTTINCAAGTFQEGDIHVDKPLTIQGAGRSSTTTIDATGHQHGFSIEADDVTIKDLIVQNATLRNIVFYTVTVSNTTIDNVASLYSGYSGLEVHHSTVTNLVINNSLFSGNYYHGMRVDTGGEVHGMTITDSHFDGNDAGMTIYNNTDHVVILNSTFNNNVAQTGAADTGGYGIYIGNANGNTATNTDWLIDNCQFKDNHYDHPDYTSGDAETNSHGIILCPYNAGFQISNMTISNSEFSGNQERGICVSSVAVATDISAITVEYCDFIGMIYGIKIGGDGATDFQVHYCNIVDNSEYGIYNSSPIVDALYNWWGDETGPEHAARNTGAQGNAVSDNVLFSPWLYKTQEEFIPGAPCYAGSVVIGKEATLVEETSYAGGWNTFSTPILLDSSADFVSELLDLTEGGGLTIVRAQRYDPVEGWVALVMGGNLIADYQINPGEGFFIQVSAKGSLPILCSMELFWPQSRELSQGWNLVGAPSYLDKLVEDGFSSLVAATVVNSPGANPASWSYPPAAGNKLLLPGRAYWVAMSADGTLMCFDGTPVADDLTWQLNQ